ncbi:hypothetical protein L218DRAFT_951779 [Marasmius fiardii PR-910]|nr:hypothetical protein L218DRAFT_951779 [Marasmius fiardii PR-910]
MYLVILTFSTVVKCKICTPLHTGKMNWIAIAWMKGHSESNTHVKALDKKGNEEAIWNQLVEVQYRENQQLQSNERLTVLRQVDIQTSSSSKLQCQPQLGTFWSLQDGDFAIEADKSELTREQLKHDIGHGVDYWDSDFLGKETRNQESLLSEDEVEDLELLAIIQGSNIDEEELVMGSVCPNSTSEYFPYETKTVFLWIMTESGAKNVPSFKHLRACREWVRVEYPDIWPHIQIYPEIPANEIIRELWHAEKWWKEMDLRNLIPMYNSHGIHYYVFESQRNIYADAFKVELTAEGKAVIQDNVSHQIRAVDLQNNFLNLQDMNLLPEWDNYTVSKHWPGQVPNPDHKLAGRDPLYSSFIGYFGDDVSRNRSKSWNKHRSLIHHTQGSCFFRSSFYIYVTKRYNFRTIPTFKNVIDIFHLYGLIDNKLFQVWKAVASSGLALCYQTIWPQVGTLLSSLQIRKGLSSEHHRGSGIQKKGMRAVKLSPVMWGKGKSNSQWPVVTLESTPATAALNSNQYNQHAYMWSCQYLVSQMGEQCKVGTWIVANSPLNQSPVIRRISQILQHAEVPPPITSSNVVIVEIFSLSDHHHNTLEMLALYQPQSEPTYLIVPPEKVKFSFNAQHDCQLAECEATGQRQPARKASI